jgi:hypothetical protein
MQSGETMIKNKLITKSWMLACAVLILTIAAMAADQSKSVQAGSTWAVDKTTELSSLTIGEGASIAAPAGHDVTMTVDGVQMDVKPGTYHGKIVLAVTDNINVKIATAMSKVNYKAALFINDGKYRSEQSVSSAVQGGSFNDTSAKDITIKSKGDKFNGIIVTGNSKYVLDNPVINLEGNGGDDNAGWGSAVMTSGKADVTLNNAKIINKGAIRGALFVCGNSTVHINDSTIETYNGVLPKNYKAPWDGGGGTGGGTMEVPWMLGLNGNVRATNIIESGTVYYNNSHFKSQGWGVLSTDGPTHIRMTVTNSTIDNLESGYGAFTIGDTIDTFSHDTFNVVDVGLIVTGFGSALITDGTVINSRRFGIMMHTNDGKFGTVTINKGSEINSRSTAIEIKGRGVKLDVDNAKINPGNGILIEAIPNDDPFVGGSGTNATTDAVLDGTPGSEKIGGMGMPTGDASAGAPSGGGAPGGAAGAPGGAAGGAAGAPGGAAGASGGGAPGGGGMPGQGAGDLKDSGGNMSGPVLATFKDEMLLGDIINARTHQGAMEITLQNTTLKGAITTAIAELAAHNTPTKTPSKAMYYMIGEVKNIFQPTQEKYGLKVSVDGSSKWTIDQTSYLTGLEVANGATITAPQGFSLKMTVDGAEKPVQPGSYTGKIVLYVTPNA